MIRTPTLWAKRFGVAHMHWEDLCSVARETKHILILRSGKEKTIPWIEKNFPGKPPELKFLKINRDSGLLEADPQDAAEWAQVFQVGHLMLDRPEKKSARLVAVGAYSGTHRDEFEVPYADAPWAKRGLVIDHKTKLPFTSDYDLGAVIDARDHRWGKTFMSVIQGGGQGSSGKTTRFADQPVSNPAKSLDLNWSNPFIDQIIDALNAKMRAHSFENGPGLPRFLHGAVSAFSGNPALKGEMLLVFYPNGLVELIGMRGVARARAHLLEILRNAPETVGAS